VALWVDASTAAGGIATVAGLLGGVVLALRYGRKASVSISGEAHIFDGLVIVATRPSVRAVGVLRLSLLRAGGGTDVIVAEMIKDGESVRKGREWTQTNVFDQQFVEAGETLATTVIFPVGPVDPEVVGWRASFDVHVKRWSLKGRRQTWSWPDRVFIPRPSSNVPLNREDAHDSTPEGDEETQAAGIQEGDGSNIT
jgi:hypothetical protein